MGPEDGKACRPRGGGDGVVCRAITDFGKAGGDYHGRADFAARTSLDRFAHSRSRQREDGKVHTRGQFVRALEYRPAVDRLATAADQMNVALNIVYLGLQQYNQSSAAGDLRQSVDG